MEKKAILILIALGLLVFLQKKFSKLSTCEAQIVYDNLDIYDDLDPEHLFAPMTAAEKAAILEDWRHIDLSPSRVIDLGHGGLMGNSRLHTISHEVDGSVHYGAIFTPVNMDDSSQYPVLLVASGLDQRHPEVQLGHSTFQYILRELGASHLVIIPSFRGQALKHKMYTYCSEGFFGDAFDGAADDAIALLNVTLAKYPQADPNRVAVYGASRGGTVALLMGIRDQRVKKVMAQAAPTDFFRKSIKNRYGFQYKYQFLSKAQPLSDIRKKILKSSPIHFAENLPELWIDHGSADRTVSVMQVKNLQDTLLARGQVKDQYIHILEGQGHQLALDRKHINWLLEW